MAENLLVATQLSSLFSSYQAISVPVGTSRKDIPLAAQPSNPDPPFEHATHSAFLDSRETGPIVLRLLHAGLIIELTSLATQTPPIRFVFPAPLLPNPSICFLGEQLHIVAITTTGSLYRIVLPLREGAPLWQQPSYKNWCREYLIESVSSFDPSVNSMRAAGPVTVTVSLKNGSLLFIESMHLGTETEDDQWIERISHHTSFLNAFTCLLHSNAPGANDIVSIVYAPLDGDAEDDRLWTLSRDRTLRMWSMANGCVAAKNLPSIPSNTGVVHSSASISTSNKPPVLLPDTPQHLLHAFTHERMLYLLAFIPTDYLATSGGFFQLYKISQEYLKIINTFECPQTTAHCHLQDFVVVDSKLYSLWDRRGQSMVESTKISFSKSTDIYNAAWTTAAYTTEAELTPAYLDELLLQPGSLTEKFFEAIMRPGMFSPLTLHTAITQYTDAALSLPPPYAAPLLAQYTNIAENIAAVVGCTVQLSRDARTGALQHGKYWNALKRDWEGFIARCREVERSARWPLALGVNVSEGKKTRLVVLERERIGALVQEDLPLQLERSLMQSALIEPQYVLLEILWKLRTEAGTRAMLALEGKLLDIVRQEIAFPYADIVQDQAQRGRFREALDEGMDIWITGRLQSVKDIEKAVRLVLDIIGGFGQEVKREEEEEAVLTRQTKASTAWSRALTASYVAMTVNARYELSLSLMTLLFFIADDLEQWDPALLAEIFVVFRGVAMLRYVSRQSAGDNTTTTDVVGDDDVVAKLRNLNVASSARTRITPLASLLQRVLTQRESTDVDLPSAAHRFLDGTGLMQSISPAYATELEVTFCEQLRLLGYREAARETLAWLPRTPAVLYVTGRLWLDLGRYDDTATAMEHLAGQFGPDSALSQDDRAALAAILPGGQMFESEFTFYLNTSSLFRSAGVTYHEAVFTQLALSVAKPGDETSNLWHSLIKGFIDLALYDDAYTAVMATPYDQIRRECISQLVYRMCEDDAVQKLMNFNFSGYADEVENAFAFKARNADPRARPFYSRILYSWYASRGDYRSAALIMYQRARKLAALLNDPVTFFELADMQLEAYVVGINALSLVDPKNAWIILPIQPNDAVHEPRKRRKLSQYIPENRYAIGKRDSEIVQLADMQYEHTLLSARLDLVRRNPTLISARDSLLLPSSVVLRLAQSNRFNTAMAVSRTLHVDMSDLFAHLTRQCLRLSRNPDAVLGEDTSDWLLTDQITSWPGTPADRGWRYLRQSLDRHDSEDTDYNYNKVVLETILGFDRTTAPPPWLIQTLQANHPEYLIRTCLHYDMLDFALEYTLSFMRKSDSHLAQDILGPASATWLPYTLMDQVLVAADSEEDLSARGQILRNELHTGISSRLKSIHKLSKSSR